MDFPDLIFHASSESLSFKLCVESKIQDDHKHLRTVFILILEGRFLIG